MMVNVMNLVLKKWICDGEAWEAGLWWFMIVNAGK